MRSHDRASTSTDLILTIDFFWHVAGIVLNFMNRIYFRRLSYFIYKDKILSAHQPWSFSASGVRIAPRLVPCHSFVFFFIIFFVILLFVVFAFVILSLSPSFTLIYNLPIQPGLYFRSYVFFFLSFFST